MLLEVIIYSALLMMVGILVFQWATSVNGMLSVRAKRSSQVLGLYAAHDLFMRDVRMAPSKATAWKKMEPNELVWHDNDHDIGWLVDNDTVVRIEGTFNPKKQQWVSTTKSLVAMGVKKGTFHVTVQERADTRWVTAVACCLEGEGSSCTITSTVAPRAGVVI